MLPMHQEKRHPPRAVTYKAPYHLRAGSDLFIIHWIHSVVEILRSLANRSDMGTKTNAAARKRACEG